MRGTPLFHMPQISHLYLPRYNTMFSDKVLVVPAQISTRTKEFFLGRYNGGQSFPGAYNSPYVLSSQYTLMVFCVDELNYWVKFAPVSSEMFNWIFWEGAVLGVHRLAHPRGKSSGSPGYAMLFVSPWVEQKVPPSTLSGGGE